MRSREEIEEAIKQQYRYIQQYFSNVFLHAQFIGVIRGLVFCLGLEEGEEKELLKRLEKEVKEEIKESDINIKHT